jgi:hypothetical protein
VLDVLRSDRRFTVDVECDFFVDMFDLCVTGSHCEFDCFVTSVDYHHYLKHPIDCVFLHNAEYIVDVSNPYFREDLQL